MIDVFHLRTHMHACTLLVFVCVSVCVSKAWVVTHFDWELRPLAGRACGPGRSQQGSKPLCSSAPLAVVGPCPCHAEEVFTRTPYWEASSMKNRTISLCLIVGSSIRFAQGSEPLSYTVVLTFIPVDLYGACHFAVRNGCCGPNRPGSIVAPPKS